ncbi:MAG: AarF/ABC1/UbiB kinase family protein, partial [Microcystaceae cyanobacterium]
AKRLLTDPSPELRTSLQELLFKEGSFRWNRLENLLRNARDSSDYDFDRVLNQATDFLFSERGQYIREKLVNELTNALDLWGRRSLFNVSMMVREQLGLKPTKPPQDLQVSGETMTHLRTIWELLQTTPGFDPMKLVPVTTQLLTNPVTHHLGQQIAEGLLQKAIARLIRNWALAWE